MSDSTLNDVSGILEEMGVDDVTPQSSFADDMDLDSTEFADFCSRVSKRFGQSVRPNQFATVAELIALLEAKRGGRVEDQRTASRRLAVMSAEVEPLTQKGGEIRVLISPKTVGAQKILMGSVRLARGEAVSAHLHDYGEECVYVVSGTGVIAIGEERLPLAAGVAVLVPVGATHSITNEGQGELDLVFASAPLAPQGKAGDRVVDDGANGKGMAR